MSYYKELDGLTIDKLEYLFDSDPIMDLGFNETETYYDEIAYGIVKFGPSGIDYLYKKVKSGDVLRISSALQALGSSGCVVANAIDIFEPFLNNQNDRVVVIAIDALKNHNIIESKNRIIELLGHASPHVVGAVLRYLAKLFPVETKPILIEYLTSKYPVIRENAVDELDDMNAVECLNEIAPLANDMDDNVRLAARTAIAHFIARNE